MDIINQIKPVFCSRATQNNQKSSILRILGGVLLAAAALKGHELLTTPIIEEDIRSSRWFLILQTEAELALGILLIITFFILASASTILNEVLQCRVALNNDCPKGNWAERITIQARINEMAKVITIPVNLMIY